LVTPLESVCNNANSQLLHLCIRCMQETFPHRMFGNTFRRGWRRFIRADI
jgi:hypothetical protein